MPSCRGITLCIISDSDSKIYPEFPHPDSSQFQYVRSQSPSSHDAKRASTLSSQERSERQSADSLDPNPSVSVYIPSLPGTRFLVQYSIDPPHTDDRKFYFKLFMNGRHITSWGINPRTMPKGQAMLGLFEADKKLKSKAQIPNPAEAKPFYFNEQKRNITAAENGGLIEVKIFRSSGKRRRIPILDVFRQDKYGIEFKSAGLLEKSRYKYFDWLLGDSKDKPHATFRFHYRSWDSLQALELIPGSCNRELLPATSSNGGFDLLKPFPEGFSQGNSPLVSGFNSGTGGSGSNNHRTPGVGIALSTNGIENTIFGQMVANDTARSKVQAQDVDSKPRPPVNDKPKKQYRIPTSSFSAPGSKKLMTWTKSQLDMRPLPELPSGNPLLRNSSSSSSTFFITPSLRSWADRDGSDSPEPVLGVAVAVQVLHSPQLNDYGRKKAISDDDASITSSGECSDTYSDIDQSFQSSLSAPPTYANSESQREKLTVLGLTLPPEAVFPPPMRSPDRVQRVQFSFESPDAHTFGPRYKADHEELGPDLGSDHGSDRPHNPLLVEAEGLSQPPQLADGDAGFAFGFESPCGHKGRSNDAEDEALETQAARMRALAALNGETVEGDCSTPPPPFVKGVLTAWP